MILIGLSGAAGSGKNYVADQITAKYENSKQLAFADPLKQVVHHMFGIPLEDCYTEAGKNKVTWMRWSECWVARQEGRQGNFVPKNGWASYMTVRDLLQWVGSDLVRYQWDVNHWVNLAEQRIRNSSEDVVVVTDVRFQNEADLITGMGGTVLKVVGRKAAGVPQHVSEHGGFTVTGMIDNSEGRTARQLIEQVEAYCGLDALALRT